MHTKKQAVEVAGPLGFPSKMPGTSYGISAKACITGAKLATIPGSTCHGCYALKANYQYPSVQQAHDKRMDGISHPAWSRAMIMMLLATHASGKGRNGPIAKGWHRWFDSGDLQSMLHLDKICTVARGTPDIRHWMPTREIGILTDYIAAGGEIPSNLTIRVSATMVDGNATKAWPVTSGVHHNKPAQGHACPAPTTGGRCDTCRACWSRDVKHVSYHLH
jgi:hypothetical protein